MEHLTSLMSSRGILRSCAARNHRPKSSHAEIDEGLLERFRPGAAIYVCTEALGSFGKDFLNRIRDPFVLVTGDSDLAVNDALLAQPYVQAILVSERLIAWYAQNLACQRPKLHAMPIGLDYHTMWERPGDWGLSAVSPIAQEHALLDALRESPIFSQRYLHAYCNWNLTINSADRQSCLNTVDKSLCLFEPMRIPRASTWMRQAEFMFVLSPEGNGMDCHRTWEALALGCIPVVRRNALADLYANLPILILEQWIDLTRERMAEHAHQVSQRKFDFSPLFREYWVRQLEGRGERVLQPLGFAEFRQILTKKTG